MLARRFSRRLCDVAARGGKGGYKPATGYGFDPLADDAGASVNMIDAFSQTGFVVNGVSLKGSLLLLPRLSVLFHVPTLQKAEALTVLSAMGARNIAQAGPQLIMLIYTPRDRRGRRRRDRTSLRSGATTLRHD